MSSVPVAFGLLPSWLGVVHQSGPKMRAILNGKKCLCAKCLTARPERRAILIRERVALKRLMGKSMPD